MKVLAVSAPHWVSNKSTATDLTFNSQTPFSLHNALRDAVNEAETNIKSRWWNSNLKDFQKRNESVLLLEFWEQDKENFELAFNKINPDILFIGAMTLSFPGAIEIAKYAKQKKGENIFIVLGGKHVNETFFKNREGLYSHHVGSPLKLMEENSIPQIFDLVISGNAEKVITKIGEIIGGLKKRGGSFSHFFEKTNILKLEQSEGDWIGGALFKNKLHYFESSIKTPINYLTLAHAVGQYNLTKGFKIFNTDYTIHGYSDTSLGCGFDCFFCSEKSSINGKLRIKSTVPVTRLTEEFKITKLLNKKKYRNKTISIFVEDSIFLAGRPDFIKQFTKECKANHLNIKFGCQFTIDTFLSLDDWVIDELSSVGLDYVAFGIETSNDSIAQTFSKNTNKKESWVKKTELIVSKCKNHNLKCGMFLIWGLGESQEDRVNHLLQIGSWVTDFQIPIDVGLNIATQHPLQIINDTYLESFNYKKYNYTDWGTKKESKYLPHFIKLFGEASEEYAIDTLPTIKEIEELEKIYTKIKNTTYSMI